MSKFKVGDMVRMKNDGLEWVKGDLGFIIIVDMNGDYKVKLTNVEWWFCEYEDEFELVELFTKLTEPKINITSGVGSGGTGGSVPVAAYPNPPHVHKDLIIAWANGAEIECYSGIPESWRDCSGGPSWYIHGTYRVKPTKTPLEIKIEKLEAKLVKLKGQL